MELQILGPIRLVTARREHELGSPKQRSLLALLALEVNRIVPRDRLVSALWPDERPANAEHNIEVYISRLRAAFREAGLAGALETRRPGYALRLEEFQIDVDRFRELAREGQKEIAGGQASLATALLDEALSIWRGPALADIADEPAIVPHAVELDALRLAVAEQRMALAVDFGDLSFAVPRLQQLLREHPARERLLELLMLALYRSGCQDEALDAYRKFRTRLDDELGLEPGPVVASLERAILRHDPTLAAPRRATVSLGNLPAPASTLVGRSAEIDTIAGRLSAGNRLVSLVGPGGVGKTRVAIAAAEAAASFFPDGTYFVDLSVVSDPALVATVLARTIDARTSGQETARDAVVRVMRNRHALILLDNFEHVLDAAILIRDVAEACPALSVLVTSRERLRLRGENAIPIAPLSPEASLELLAVRVRDARGTELRAGEVGAAQELCERLDGLPLAIELAATQLRARGAAKVLGQVAAAGIQSIGAAETIDSPLRHATLGNMYSWSRSLLPEATQSAIPALAWFRGGFDREAASAIAGADEHTLARLVESSLLLRTSPDRYAMLEILRELALEEIDELDARVIADAHAAWFFALAAEAERELAGPGQGDWLARLDREAGNVSVAVSHLAATNPARALELAASLWRYWEVRPGEREQLVRLSALPNEDVPPSTSTRYHHAVGRVALRQGRLETAEAAFRESLRMADAAGRSTDVALAASGLGWVKLLNGDLDEALDLCSRAVEEAQSSHDSVLAEALNNLGCVLMVSGSYDRSAQLHERAAEIRRRLGERAGLAASLYNFAAAVHRLGDSQKTAELLQESLDLSRSTGDDWSIAGTLIALGQLELESGEPSSGVGHVLVEAIERARRLSHRSLTADALRLLGSLAAMQGDPVTAAELWGAEEAFATDEHPSDEIDVGHSLKRALLDRLAAESRPVVAEASARGSSMPLDDVITLARRLAQSRQDAPVRAAPAG